MKKETRNKIFFAVLCAFIVLFNASSNAATSSTSTSSTKTTSSTKAASTSTSKTMTADSSAGTGNGGSGTVTPDLYSGTMSYSVPIEVPVGRKGMAPSLALTYRSDNGNGWVGIGWDVEIGAIERSTKNGVVFTGDSGGYVLRMAGSGIDLVRISTDESGNTVTNEYRAKIEGGFLRIRKLSGTNGDYWEVTDKSGTRHLYGQTAASRQDDSADTTRIFKWCLDRVQDMHGNYMTFSYTKDQGQIYPDQIDYTGNGTTVPTNYVKFYLENRTDAGNMYSTNFSVNTTKRAKTIDVVVNNGQFNRVRVYKLSYAYSSSTSRSVLASVQQFGKDANVDVSTGNITNESTASKLPATQFGWQKGSDGTYNKVVTSASYDWDARIMIPGDYNGDGKTDFLSYYAGNLFTLFSKGDGTYDKVVTSASYDWDARIMIPGDYNGDGKTDFLSYYTGNLFTLSPNGYFPDLLTTISNGIGGTTTITYKPSTQYQNTQLPFPVQTVSSVTTCDNYNSSSGTCIGTSSTTNYTYSGGFFHIGEKDFRGFNYVKVTGPVGPNNEQAISETWFHQGNDTTVDVNNPNVSVGYMKGKPYRTRVSDANGAIYAETTTIYSSGTGTAPYFNPPLQVDAYICDGTVSSPNTCAASTSAMHTKTVYTDDQYGNITEEDQYGDVNDPTDDRTVIRSFAYNTTAWILNKPVNEALYSGVTGTTLVKVSSTTYYYDGVTDCTTPSTNQTPTQGNLTRTVRWLDGTNDPELRMAYDTYGNLKCTRDAKGNTATLTYDSLSTFLKITTNPLGQQTTTQYYGVDGVQADNGLYGQVKSQTDPNNATVTTAYDNFGRKVNVTLPGTTSTTWAYNNFGTVGSQNVQTTNAAGLSIWTYFDGVGRTFTTKRTGPNSKIIAAKTVYNATSTVAQSSLPYFDGTETPRYTTFTYDPLGRVKRANNPDGTYALGCYQEGVSVSINADNQKKRETKNAQGKLVKVEEYLGTFTPCTTDSGTPYATTNYAYDVLGNLLMVTDAEGNQTKMWYDPLGRKTSMQDPDMGSWTYTYYPTGNLWTQTDAKGQTITFTYDAINRVVLKHYPSGTDVTYTYDEPFSTNPIGRLTTMSDASGTTQYYYDALGRTTKSVKTINGQNYANVVGYDNIGRMSSLTYPDNEVVNYAYDAGGNLSLVSAPTGSTYVSYANYNALGQAGTASYGNGVATTYQYLATNNRLQNITTSSASQIMNLTYGYDNGGNLTGITDNIDNTKSQAFIYDDLNRLWQAQSTRYGALFYAYDQIGNIVSKETISYTYDPAGNKPHAVRSTSDGKTYTYDANGNMLADGTRTMTYNYDNMPQTIIASAATTTFVYDGNGVRVKKSTSTGDDIYIGKVYECKVGVCSKYIFAGGTRIAHKTSATDIVYYHQDHLGSTRLITDRNGSKMEDIYYYPFGAAQSDTGGVSMSHKFTSQEFDAETGLYNYNARFYNPALGRFISPDGIVPNPLNPQGFNRYSYVGNNPLNYTDPTGHFSLSIGGFKLSIGSSNTLNNVLFALAPGYMMYYDKRTQGVAIAGSIGVLTGGVGGGIAAVVDYEFLNNTGVGRKLTQKVAVEIFEHRLGLHPRDAYFAAYVTLSAVITTGIEDGYQWADGTPTLTKGPQVDPAAEKYWELMKHAGIGGYATGGGDIYDVYAAGGKIYELLDSDGNLVGLYGQAPAFGSGWFGNLIGLQHTTVVLQGTDGAFYNSLSGFGGGNIYGATSVCHQMTDQAFWQAGYSNTVANMMGTGIFTNISSLIYGSYGGSGLVQGYMATDEKY
jgi:RHS repeat-associated protein